jgi:hypothetical protein
LNTSIFEVIVTKVSFQTKLIVEHVSYPKSATKGLTTAVSSVIGFVILKPPASSMDHLLNSGLNFLRALFEHNVTNAVAKQVSISFSFFF